MRLARDDAGFLRDSGGRRPDKLLRGRRGANDVQACNALGRCNCSSGMPRSKPASDVGGYQGANSAVDIASVSARLPHKLALVEELWSRIEQ